MTTQERFGNAMKVVREIKDISNKSEYDFDYQTQRREMQVEIVNDALESERNKTIDEVVEKLDKGYRDYVWFKHLKEEINSLKI